MGCGPTQTAAWPPGRLAACRYGTHRFAFSCSSGRRAPGREECDADALLRLGAVGRVCGALEAVPGGGARHKSLRSQEVLIPFTPRTLLAATAKVREVHNKCLGLRPKRIRQANNVSQTFRRAVVLARANANVMSQCPEAATTGLT